MADYTCAISGLTAPASEAAEGELDDLPTGWARVTVEIRNANPRWEAIQEAKAQLIAAQLGQIPEAQREGAKAFTAIMVDAQFAALEAATPRFLQVDHVVEVSAEELAGFSETLGLEGE